MGTDRESGSQSDAVGLMLPATKNEGERKRNLEARSGSGWFVRIRSAVPLQESCNKNTFAARNGALAVCTMPHFMVLAERFADSDKAQVLVGKATRVVVTRCEAGALGDQLVRLAVTLGIQPLQRSGRS